MDLKHPLTGAARRGGREGRSKRLRSVRREERQCDKRVNAPPEEFW